MIAFKPSPSPVAGANGAVAAPANLHARLSAATEALLKTRDQVIEALDQHLHELDMLRSALGTNEKTLLPTLPAISAEVAPVPQYFERPPQAASLPLLTQVLWPSKHDAPAPMPARVPAPAAVSPAPVSSPLVAYSSLQSSSSQDLAMDPDLEKATLEELNAALAYAFSHVSSARTGAASSPSQAAADGPAWANSGNQGFTPGR